MMGFILEPNLAWILLDPYDDTLSPCEICWFLDFANKINKIAKFEYQKFIRNLLVKSMPYKFFEKNRREVHLDRGPKYLANLPS